MKKKMSPFMLVGFITLIIGGVFQIVFRFIDVSWDYTWLTICVSGIATILLAIGIYKTQKAQKSNKE